MSEKPAELVSREIGPPKPYRLWVDQQEWLDRMERERSVNTAALVRAALDAYIPVFESLGDRSEEALRRKAIERVEQVLELVPAQRLLEVMDELESEAAEVRGNETTTAKGETAA